MDLVSRCRMFGMDILAPKYLERFVILMLDHSVSQILRMNFIVK